MEGVRETMTQKMFTKCLPAQAGKIVRKGEILAVEIEIGENDKVIIRNPYNQELIRKIKPISGRRWTPEKKYWEISYSEGVISKLQNLFDEDILIGSILALSANITPKWHHISTKSTDITTLCKIAGREELWVKNIQ